MGGTSEGVVWKFFCLFSMLAYFLGVTYGIILGILISSFIQLLVALKVRYPQRITVLRGNHESRQVYFCNLLCFIFLIFPFVFSNYDEAFL